MGLKYNYVFVTDEIVTGLNSLGFAHFITKSSGNSFTVGRAFYYCIENKEYGYVDVVPNKELHNIEANTNYILNQLKDK